MNIQTLPEKLLQEHRLLKAVAFFNKEAQLVSKAGGIIDATLLRLAGTQIQNHQILVEDLGWQEDFYQSWQKSSKNQFAVLLWPFNQEHYLFILTFSCQANELERFLNTLKQQYLKFPTEVALSSQSKVIAAPLNNLSDQAINSTASKLEITFKLKKIFNDFRLLSASVGLVLIPIAGLVLSILKFPFQLQIVAIFVFTILLLIAMSSIYFMLKKAIY